MKAALKDAGLDRRGHDPFPQRIPPMLATPGGAPFTDPQWLFEVKWDGIRALAYIQGERRHRTVRLQGRSLRAITVQYPEVVEALTELPLSWEAVLDGEIVAPDEQGKISFQRLQQRMHLSREKEIARARIAVPVVYYVFDLLYINGHSLLDRPLVERRGVLESLLPSHPVVRLSEAVVGEGEAFYQAARDLGLEGIIAKRADGQYEPGKRSSHWIKIKLVQRQEAVVGGFTRGRGRRHSTLGALLLGIYNDRGELEYIGHTGSGFTEEELRELLSRLNSLRRATCPFTRRPQTNEKPTWVYPEMVVEVEHGGWTRDGILRFPIYKGLRADKSPREVRRE